MTQLGALPRTVIGRFRQLGRRTPLRVRLVAVVLLLVIIALLGTGAAATATLSSYLVGRVDNQLSSIANQPGNLLTGTTAVAGDRNGKGDSGGDGHVGGPPSAFITEISNADGTPAYATHNLISSDEPLPELPQITAAQSKADGRRLITVHAMRGHARWRVLIEPVTLSDGKPGTLLIAQSLGDVENTITHLIELLAGIGAAAVLVIAGVGYFIVRASLRPLRAVEHTAAKIAAGDLTLRVPQSDPHTEVGHLAGALNTMLGEIETAFTGRAASERAALSSSEQARSSEAAARRSEQRMRRFVADASHELRTPLTSIRGFAELYRQGAVAEPEQLDRVMRRIEDEGARMGLLVEDLLMLARMDAERPLARDPVDLLALASEAVQSARASAPDRSITLQVGNTDPPPVVSGDDARLRQVFANLLANAIKYTPQHTPITVDVTTTTSERTGAPTAVLTVTDQGPGLSPEAAERVFERFYRADTARNRDDGGSGLGLAIVAAIIAGHDGSVTVDTAPGEGARFRIELPLADSAACTNVEDDAW
ncbi:MAG: ATP-binding protein [Jatrophihabitans sp.]